MNRKIILNGFVLFVSMGAILPMALAENSCSKIYNLTSSQIETLQMDQRRQLILKVDQESARSHFIFIKNEITQKMDKATKDLQRISAAFDVLTSGRNSVFQRIQLLRNPYDSEDKIKVALSDWSSNYRQLENQYLLMIRNFLISLSASNQARIELVQAIDQVAFESNGKAVSNDVKFENEIRRLSTVLNEKEIVTVVQLYLARKELNRSSWALVEKMKNYLERNEDESLKSSYRSFEISNQTRIKKIKIGYEIYLESTNGKDQLLIVDKLGNVIESVKVLSPWKKVLMNKDKIIVILEDENLVVFSTNSLKVLHQTSFSGKFKIDIPKDLRGFFYFPFREINAILFHYSRPYSQIKIYYGVSSYEFYDLDLSKKSSVNLDKRFYNEKITLYQGHPFLRATEDGRYVVAFYSETETVHLSSLRRLAEVDFFKKNDRGGVPLTMREVVIYDAQSGKIAYKMDLKKIVLNDNLKSFLEGIQSQIGNKNYSFYPRIVDHEHVRYAEPMPSEAFTVENGQFIKINFVDQDGIQQSTWIDLAK